MKRARAKGTLCAFLCALCCASALAGCAENAGPAFLPGCARALTLGDTLIVEEYIDVSRENFTLTVSKGDWSLDLTDRAAWSPEEAGEYLLTYTIAEGDGKGTATLSVTVGLPDLQIAFTAPARVFEKGETVAFSELFESMDFIVKPECAYTIAMRRVFVGGRKIPLEGKTEFAFEEPAEHLFIFTLTAEDGQKLTQSFKAKVEYHSPQAMAWAEQQNISLYGDTIFDENRRVVLKGGSFGGKTDAVLYTDLPYLAYEGTYGAGDYVTFDFKGSNLPKLAFFCDPVSENLTDGGKGIYLNNGFHGVAASESSRFTVYGPYKLKEKCMAGYDRMAIVTNAAIGAANLDSETDYRYIAGFSDPVAGTVNAQTGETEGGSITLHAVLIDVKTGEVVFRYDKRLDQTFTRAGKYEPCDFPEGYFSGSIVAYGDYGVDTTWSKVYAVARNTSIEELCAFAEFKPSPKTTARPGETLRVSDFADTTGLDDYYFAVKSEDGSVKRITGETFSIPRAGQVTLSFKHGETLAAEMTLSVGDWDEQTYAFMAEKGITASGVKAIGPDNAVTLGGGGSYAGGDFKEMLSTDLPYLAFHGDYGLGQYAVFEFTGNNLPMVALFNDRVSGNIVNAKGVLFSNGVYKTYNPATGAGTLDNTIHSRFYLYGPDKLKSGNIWLDFLAADTADPPLSYKNLADSRKRYRYIVGATADETTVTFSARLVDLGSMETVYAKDFPVAKARLGEGFVYGGSVVAYARPWESLTIDKFYAVRQASSADEAVGYSQFQPGARTAVFTGETLSVSDYVSNAGDAYTLGYHAGDPAAVTPIPGDSFSFDAPGTYTLVYFDGENVKNTLTVTATDDVAKSTREFMEANGIEAYLATPGADNAIALAAGTLTGGKAFTATDLAYFAYKGNYGLGSYVTVDFRGKHMPKLAFFCDTVTGDLADGGKGVVVSNGFEVSSSVNNGISLYAPNKVAGGAEAATGRRTYSKAGLGLEAGLNNLSENGRYRLIAGVYEATASRISVSIRLTDLETGESVCALTAQLAGSYAADAFDGGNIVVYGQNDRALNVEKMYAVRTVASPDSGSIDSLPPFSV